jgi:uncharacterized membrane protein (DUF106 family)
MNETGAARIASLLKEIRDDQRGQIERQTEALALQRQQIERQAEALALQREQFAMVRRQFERTEKLQDRAEAIQTKSAQLVKTARRSVLIALPVLVILILYLTWLLFRHWL